MSKVILQPVNVDENTNNATNNTITEATQVFYAHKATDDTYGVVTLTTFDTKIANAVSTHNNDNNAHNGRITTNETHISTNTTDINNIKSEQITQNTNISTNANNIQTLQTEVANTVDLTSEQTITGNKNFTGNLEQDGNAVLTTLDYGKISNAIECTGRYSTSTGYAGVYFNITEELKSNTIYYFKLSYSGSYNPNDAVYITANGHTVILNTPGVVNILANTFENLERYKIGQILTLSSQWNFFALTQDISGVGYPNHMISVADNLTNYVDLTTNQTITAQKNFTGNLLSNGETVATEEYVDTEISNITTIQIRNKEPNLVINATEATVQTVATQYMVDNYSRQPQSYDGLYITFENGDVVEYDYYNSAWVNVGINNVDLSNYVDLTSSQTISGNKNFTGQLMQNGNAVATLTQVDTEIYNNIGKEQQVDFNATLSGNVITGILDSSIADFVFSNGTGYLIHISLPLTTLTGDLNNSYTIILQDKDENNININCIFQKDITQTSTVGNLCQIQDYNNLTGYSWEFYAHYNNINNNGTTVQVMYTDTVVRETNPSMTGEDLCNAILNNTLKVGTTTLVTSTYTNGTITYTKSHIYLITGQWVGDELITDTEDITPQTIGIEITIAVADWTNNQATKYISSVKANNSVWVGPTSASYLAYANSIIRADTNQVAGQITFICTTTPTTDIVVNVITGV